MWDDETDELKLNYLINRNKCIRSAEKICLSHQTSLLSVTFETLKHYFADLDLMCNHGLP